MPKSPETRSLKVYLDPEVWFEFKVLSAKNRRTMSSIAAELIAEWNEKQKEANDGKLV